MHLRKETTYAITLPGAYVLLFQEPVYKLIWSNCSNCLISLHTSQRGSSYINIPICVYRCNERLWYQDIVQTLMSYKSYPGELHIDKDAMLSPLTRWSLTWKYIAKGYIFIMSEYETSKHFLEKHLSNNQNICKHRFDLLHFVCLSIGFFTIFICYQSF